MDTTYVGRLVLEAARQNGVFNEAQAVVDAEQSLYEEKRENVLEYLNETWPTEKEKRRHKSVKWPCIVVNSEKSSTWLMDIKLGADGTCVSYTFRRIAVLAE